MTIIKIGYSAFAIKDDRAAARIIQAFAGAVEVEQTFRLNNTYYWPSDRQREISMTNVNSRFLLSRKPTDDSDIEVFTDPMGLVRPNRKS